MKRAEKNKLILSKREMAALDIRDFLIKIGMTILFGWILFGFLFGVAVMEGEDMYPRLRDGDLMIYYRLQDEYHIGDVVTFKQNDRRYTGRIVAQGNDVVDINDKGQLLVNGNVQTEEIFYPIQKTNDSIDLPCALQEGEIFLLSDFRTNGTDSRSYGPVQIEELDGKVITILRRRGI